MPPPSGRPWTHPRPLFSLFHSFLPAVHISVCSQELAGLCQTEIRWGCRSPSEATQRRDRPGTIKPSAPASPAACKAARVLRVPGAFFPPQPYVMPHLATLSSSRSQYFSFITALLCLIPRVDREAIQSFVVHQMCLLFPWQPTHLERIFRLFQCH